MEKYLGYVEKIRTFMNIPLGQEVFDPRMIVSQIFLLQTTCYISVGVISFFLDALVGKWVCLDQLFSYRAFSLYSLFGGATMISWILGSFMNALAMYFVIQRSRKCLDFTLTFYFVHFFVCVFFKGFPIHWEWWICMVLCAIIQSVLGEFLCYRRELQYIPIKKKKTKEKQDTKIEVLNTDDLEV
eukprot:gene8358-183_t